MRRLTWPSAAIGASSLLADTPRDAEDWGSARARSNPIEAARLRSGGSRGGPLWLSSVGRAECP